MYDNKTTPKKSISLPKIRTNTQNDLNKKPFKQLHKTKWSISPKCLI